MISRPQALPKFEFFEDASPILERLRGGVLAQAAFHMDVLRLRDSAVAKEAWAQYGPTIANGDTAGCIGVATKFQEQILSRALEETCNLYHVDRESTREAEVAVNVAVFGTLVHVAEFVLPFILLRDGNNIAPHGLAQLENFAKEHPFVCTMRSCLSALLPDSGYIPRGLERHFPQLCDVSDETLPFPKLIAHGATSFLWYHGYGEAVKGCITVDSEEFALSALAVHSTEFLPSWGAWIEVGACMSYLVTAMTEGRERPDYSTRQWKANSWAEEIVEGFRIALTPTLRTTWGIFITEETLHSILRQNEPKECRVRFGSSEDH